MPEEVAGLDHAFGRMECTELARTLRIVHANVHLEVNWRAVARLHIPYVHVYNSPATQLTVLSRC